MVAPKGGGLDDTAAIQALIDQAHTAYVGSGQRQHVLLRTGTFRGTFTGTPGAAVGGNYTPCLTMRSGVQLDGERGARLALDPLAHTTLNGTQNLAGATITVASTAGFAASGQIQFDGLNDIVNYTDKTLTTFIGCTGGTHTGGTGIAVIARLPNVAIMTDPTATVTDWGVSGLILDGQGATAIEIDAPAVIVWKSSDWEVTRNEIKNFNGKALHVMGDGAAYAPARWRFSENNIHACASNVVGYSLTGATDFFITDNFMHDMSALGAESIIGLGGLGATQTARGVIARNIIRNWGTLDTGGTDMWIVDNYINNLSTSAGPGIRLHISTRLTVRGNTIDNSATTDVNAWAIKHGDDPGSTDLEITGNKILCGSGSGGILLIPTSGTFTRAVVQRNTLIAQNASANATIAASSCSHLVISGNVLSGTPSQHIVMGGTNDTCAVNGNIVDGAPSSFSFTDGAIANNTFAVPTSGAFVVFGAHIAITGNKVKCGGNSVQNVQLNGLTYSIITGNVIETTGNSSTAIVELNASDYNDIAHNVCVNPGTGTGYITTAGAHSKVRFNSGNTNPYVTENGGNASIADGGTIAHGLWFTITPSQVEVTTSNAAHIASVTAVDATNITVGLKVASTGAAVAVAEKVYWRVNA